jgi:acetoacetate decarboxylase
MTATATVSNEMVALRDECLLSRLTECGRVVTVGYSGELGVATSRDIRVMINTHDAG